MIKWLRKLLGIEYSEAKVVQLEKELASMHRRILQLEKWTEDVVTIGVDVHFKSPHMILIYTRLGGGQIREIECNFEDIRQVTELVNELRYRYRVREKVWFDAPPPDREYLKEMTHSKTTRRKK